MRPFSLAMCLALLVSLLSALGLPTMPGIAARPATAGVGCVAPAGNLVTNGSFESPDISPNASQVIGPTGWTGGERIYHNGTSPDGNQHVALFRVRGLEQSISTTGLAGTTLTLTYLYQASSTVTLGTTSISQPIGAGFRTGTATYQVPSVDPPPSVVLRFEGNDLDAVSVTAACPSTNSPPVIAGGVTTLRYTVNERRAGQTALTIPLSLPLSDPDGDALTLEITAPEDQHGLIIGLLAGNGMYSTSYRPDNGYVGPDQYGVLVSDGSGGTLTLLINVTVRNTNDPPVARGETLGDSPEDTVRVIPFADLLANDSPGRNDAAAGDVLIVSAVDQPVGGTAAIVGQTVEFTSTAGYDGPASFRYTVRDQSSVTAQATASFTITAVDDPPVIDDATVPEDITVEATSSAGAIVTFTPPTATDPDIGDTVTVTCVPASGATFALGETDVICTASDGDTEDTATFTVTVEDTTAPTLTVPANITAEATSNAGAAVAYTATATDLVDGPVTPVCSPASGSLFPIGTTTVRCTAMDSRGNTTAPKTFTVTVGDSTGPVITWVGGPQPNRSYTQATLPGEPTCTATDAAHEVTQCRVYGYSTAPGTHTLTARARDAEGNSSVSTRTYTVTASAPTATPRPPTVTPRPTSVPPTATPTRPTRPTATPSQPTATTAPVQPTATPVTPVVQPTATPTRPPRR